MNLQRFDELMKVAEGRLGQSTQEWRCFLEFADAHFKERGITNPVVVEIGVLNNAQKPFYIELLNADHMGIDVSGQPDIMGDSKLPMTLEKLKQRLGGRSIDLLFIDGDHAYQSVKSDYEMYGPLTKHLVALHDISNIYNPPWSGDVMRLWKEITETNKSDLLLTIHIDNSLETGITAGYQMGIGLIIRGSA